MFVGRKSLSEKCLSCQLFKNVDRSLSETCPSCQLFKNVNRSLSETCPSCQLFKNVGRSLSFWIFSHMRRNGFHISHLLSLVLRRCTDWSSLLLQSVIQFNLEIFADTVLGSGLRHKCLGGLRLSCTAVRHVSSKFMMQALRMLDWL